MLHVQNMVLDNCLSTIKHETIYYPNKIKQLIGRLNAQNLSEKEEKEAVETMTELIEYYKMCIRDRYKGGCVDGLEEGQGVQTDKDGNRFEGFFKQGKKNARN